MKREGDGVWVLVKGGNLAGRKYRVIAGKASWVPGIGRVAIVDARLAPIQPRLASRDYGVTWMWADDEGAPDALLAGEALR